MYYCAFEKKIHIHRHYTHSQLHQQIWKENQTTNYFWSATNGIVLLVNNKMNVHCASVKLIGNDSTPLAGLVGLPWQPKSSCTQTWNAGSKITLLHNLEEKKFSALRALTTAPLRSLKSFDPNPWAWDPLLICPHSNKPLTQRCSKPQNRPDPVDQVHFTASWTQLAPV